jgi:hypothetical protein
VIALEEVGLETKFHQPDFFYDEAIFELAMTWARRAAHQPRA